MRGSNAAPAQLLLSWTPMIQSLSVDEAEFVHLGPTITDPSHDLAHLLIAANNIMLWRPEGPVDEVKLAEYNAVFLGHLLNDTYDVLVADDPDYSKAVMRASEHMRWFVEEHFAPFP